MGSYPFIFSIFLSFCVIVSCSAQSTNDTVIYPNFTASGIHYIIVASQDSIGFLASPNGTFKAAIVSPGGLGGSGTNYYLSVLHVLSNTIIWSANRNTPVAKTGYMNLTATGMIVAEEDGTLQWSTPPLSSSVKLLQLTEAGNLVLLDQSNAILWQSFSYPTDTIVIGQKLPIGTHLSSAVSTTDLSVGNYWLSLTATDALLQWQNMTYWMLTSAAAYTTNSSYPVEYMAINQTGLYLFGNNGSAVISYVNLNVSAFGIAKLDYSGQFSVSNFSTTAGFLPLLVGPDDKCQIPFICGTLGLCTDNANNLVCSCPSNFHFNSQSQQNQSVCVPNEGAYSLPNSCNSTDDDVTSSSSFSYLSLGYGIDYFANDFTNPVKSGVTMSVCEDICSSECSCLGIFFDNSSNSCYVLQNQLGSFMSSTSNEDRLGFIKVIALPSNSGHTLGFPIVAIVLLPLIGLFL